MSRTLPRGILIAVDGIDGSGKTTLVRGLERALTAANLTVAVTKEPTNGPWGQKVRESAATGRLPVETEFEYLLKDREEHVRDFIKPMLATRDIVITDRYYFSTVAYQGSMMDYRFILAQNEKIAPVPDLSIILDLDVGTSLGRIAARGDQPNHFERDQTLTRCREIFTLLGNSYANTHLVDASQPAAAVLHEALQLLLLRIGKVCVDELGLSVETADRLRPLFAAKAAAGA